MNRMGRVTVAPDKDESDPSETRVVEPTTAQAHDMRVPLNMGPSI